MKLPELTRQRDRLESLFKRANDASGTNVEMLSHWARYLCVLSAGFLEIALQEVYCELVHSSSGPSVQRFATAQLRRIQNPKARRFIEVAASFDRAWGDQLTTFLDESGRREAIDSIMTNRHQIAHGKDSDITIARLREYLLKSVQAIEFIEKQCGI